jgi:hypothetical protein
MEYRPDRLGDDPRLWERNLPDIFWRGDTGRAIQLVDTDAGNQKESVYSNGDREENMTNLFQNGDMRARKEEYVTGLTGDLRGIKDVDNTVIPEQGKTEVNGDEFGKSLIRFGEQQLGLPYELGGDGKTSTDCGQFTLDTYNKMGLDLGTRVSDEQYEYCKTNGSVFQDIAQAKPGDMVFFHNTYGDWKPGTVTHVGIYAGEGKMLHASGSRGVSYADLSNEYWKGHFTGFGRVSK